MAVIITKLLTFSNIDATVDVVYQADCLSILLSVSYSEEGMQVFILNTWTFNVSYITTVAIAAYFGVM